MIWQYLKSLEVSAPHWISASAATGAVIFGALAKIGMDPANPAYASLSPNENTWVVLAAVCAYLASANISKKKGGVTS